MLRFASGDLNNDGYNDAYVSMGVARQADELFMNFGGDNKYLKLSLVGSTSNRNGIGSKVELYTGGQKITRWLKSGSAYGITNSLNLHFGCADNERVDSLVCYWSSGVVDRYYDLDTDTHYVMEEGECIEEVYNFMASDYTLDCNTSEIRLSLREGDSFILSEGQIIGGEVVVAEPQLLSCY